MRQRGIGAAGTIGVIKEVYDNIHQYDPPPAPRDNVRVWKFYDSTVIKKPIGR